MGVNPCKKVLYEGVLVCESGYLCCKDLLQLTRTNKPDKSMNCLFMISRIQERRRTVYHSGTAEEIESRKGVMF